LSTGKLRNGGSTPAARQSVESISKGKEQKKTHKREGERRYISRIDANPI